MTFGRKGTAFAQAGNGSPKRPTNVAQVIGRPARKPKTNRMFGSVLFFLAAIVIGGFGIWIDRQNSFYYDHGIPVAGEVVGSRLSSGSGQPTRLYEVQARHPQFGQVTLELAKPKNLSPLPSGSAATEDRVLVLLHPDDPESGRISSANGSTSPVVVTTIMALAFGLVAFLNLFSERRIIGSRKTRLRKD